MNSPASQPQFRLLLRVRYSECDPQGVVFNAKYVEYVDITMTEYFRVAFGGYEQLVSQGTEIQVVSVKVDWSAPLKADDVIALDVSLIKIGSSSITYEVAISDTRTETIAAVCTIVYVAVDAVSFTKKQITSELAELLKKDAEGKTVNMSGCDVN